MFCKPICRDDDNYGIVLLCPYARRCRIKTTYRPTDVKRETPVWKAHGNAFLRIISDVYSFVTLHYGNWNCGSKSIDSRQLSSSRERERELEGNSFNVADVVQVSRWRNFILHPRKNPQILSSKILSSSPKLHQSLFVKRADSTIIKCTLKIDHKTNNQQF